MSQSFTPYAHQQAGIDWIIKRPSSALLWGMGTGKTVTTLTAIDQILYDNMEDGPVLVIAPKRVAENTWSKETAKWEHLKHLRVRKIMGTEKQRKEALISIFEGPFSDIYVINRENVVWLVERLQNRWPFPIVVIDELSSFKSIQAKRWKALRKVRGRIKRIIGLTGTPRPNGLEDLFPEMYLLDQGDQKGDICLAQEGKHHFVVGSGTDAAIHQLNDELEQINVGVLRKIAVCQGGPLRLIGRRSFCKAVSGQVNKEQCLVNIVKVDGNGLTGRGADTCQRLAAEQRVDQRTFAYVRSAGKGDLHHSVTRELLGQSCADAKLGFVKIECHIASPLGEIDYR